MARTDGQDTPKPTTDPYKVNTPAKPEESKPAESKVEKTGGETEIKFFDGTVAKIDKFGNEVLSDHLAPGEKLRRETEAGKRYEPTPRPTEEDNDRK